MKIENPLNFKVFPDTQALSFYNNDISSLDYVDEVIALIYFKFTTGLLK